VVMPLRRGFGETAGEFAENPGSCSHPDFLRGERAAAQDVLTRHMREFLLLDPPPET